MPPAPKGGGIKITQEVYMTLAHGGNRTLKLPHIRCGMSCWWFVCWWHFRYIHKLHCMLYSNSTFTHRHSSVTLTSWMAKSVAAVDAWAATPYIWLHGVRRLGHAHLYWLMSDTGHKSGACIITAKPLLTKLFLQKTWLWLADVKTSTNHSQFIC